MKTQLSNINIEASSNADGTYDAYISTEASSGEQYYNITADEIGDIVSDLIDTLDEAATGKRPATIRYELIETDGYNITRNIYDSLKNARQAMKKAYTELNQNNLITETEKKWAEMSYCRDYNAILYDRGKNVYVWHIYPCKN